MLNEKKIQMSGKVSANLDHVRLDQALSALFTDYSRAQSQRWIKEGAVYCNGIKQNKIRYKVTEGELITIDADCPIQSHWIAQDLPVEIVYEDEDLLIVNKPRGLVVHPGAGNPDKTLVNALLHYAPELSEVPRAGIIHRLDKDTSGLLIIARHISAHHHLINAMKRRDIKREYHAIVHGQVTTGGTIETYIDRDPRRRTQMAVVRQGRIAITHYSVLQRFRAHTHLQVQLETGRTHQIRVHMQHINHPIVGDPTYGKAHNSHKKDTKTLNAPLTTLQQQQLHARRLSLEHPKTKERLNFESALPQDMQQLLAVLENDHNDHE